MNPATLLSDLRRRGIELTAEGDRLRYRAPRGVLSPKLLADLRSHKAEILAGLSAPYVQLDNDWAAAWTRARNGFAVHGTSPTYETLEAAALLELWITDGGPPRLGLTLEDLNDWTQAIYRGRVSARASADGHAVLRGSSNPSSPPSNGPSRPPP